MSVTGLELEDGPPVVHLRLLAPALTAWAVCWWSTGASVQSSYIACAAGILAAAVGGIARWRLLVGLAAALVGAAASGGLHVAALRSGPLPAMARAGERVSVRLTVATDPVLHQGHTAGSQLMPDLVLLRATVTSVALPRPVVGLHSTVLLLVSGDTQRWMALSPSQRLVVDGKLQPPRPDDDLTAVLTARGPPQLVGTPTMVEQAAGVVRAGLRAAVRGQSADVRGLLPGLVLGDVSRMDPDLTADFRTAGLTHLVAVSGANVAILFAVVLAVARFVRVPPRTAMVCAAVVLIGFVVLVRPTPSVLRAAVMAGLLVVAALTGRLRQPMSALLGAVLLLMLVDPELSRSAGFALSTVATAALLVVAPRWAVVLRRRLPRRLADSLAVATAAQLACGPLIALLSGQVSLVAVPANLLAEPAVPFATVFGVLAAVTAPVAMPLARILAEIAALPTIWLIEVARHAAAAPSATVSWSQSALGAVTLAVLTVGVVLALRHRLARILIPPALVLALVGARVAAGPFAQPGWVLVACDVGQGDGFVLRAGPDSAVVVDAGPAPALMQSCLDRLHVHHVALAVLSHLHADHVEGLPGVLAGRRVDRVAIGSLAEPPTEYARVLAMAAAARVPVEHLSAGNVLAFADLTLTVVGPTEVVHGSDNDPDNDSLVIRAVTPSVSILFTGDIEQQSQSALLESGARIDADILKVPHHGSADQSPLFLAAVGATAAITSVGAGNDYGQPAPTTMAALAADGARGFRTDTDGAVEVDVAAGRVSISGHRGSGTPGRRLAQSLRRPGPDQRPAQREALAAAMADPRREMLTSWQVRAPRSARSPSCWATRSCWSPARSPPSPPPYGRPTLRRT